MTIKKSKKVAVGVSGGVDSSVALKLLKSSGYEPIGFFMKFWGKENHCCGMDSERRARKTCQKLNIPFYVLDVRDEFKSQVVDYFLRSYQMGETPNPCVACNREIKFKTLFRKIREFEGTKVATGHYAQIEDGLIMTPKDRKKDQTYFMWSFKKELLDNIVFPLGSLKKTEVRKVASRTNMPTADVPESQEVCFVKEDLSEFLRSYIDLIPGDIEDKHGKKLGTHIGLPVYTIGQRKGIGLSGGPFYVLKKDVERNVLVVTKNDRDLFKKKVRFRKENFFKDLSFPLEVEAKIRYNGPREKGVLESKNNFEFVKAQRAITPGQSIVFYKKNNLLGGGVIN